MRTFASTLCLGLGFIYVLTLTGCAVGAARAPETQVPPNEDVPLAGLANGAVDVGAEVTEYVVPFTLASIPDRAALHLQFGVVRKGRCPVTYRPTTIAVNDKSVTTLDFRKFQRGAEKDVRVPIPNEVLKVGENLLRIQTGGCQFDIDVMRLNNITLMQR